MPVERVSRGFKDISMSFQVNPLNYDIIAVTNETAIARSIRNLVLTNKGERFFDPLLGSRVNEILFDTVDYVSASSIENSITEVINNYEPRVELIGVDVNPNFDNNEMNVAIRYYIVGIDAQPQQLTFALQPTR